MTTAIQPLVHSCQDTTEKNTQNTQNKIISKMNKEKSSLTTSYTSEDERIYQEANSISVSPHDWTQENKGHMGYDNQAILTFHTSDQHTEYDSGLNTGRGYVTSPTILNKSNNKRSNSVSSSHSAKFSVEPRVTTPKPDVPQTPIKGSSKNKNKNKKRNTNRRQKQQRRASETVQRLQKEINPDSTDEDKKTDSDTTPSTSEYELYLAFPSKRTAELIGSGGKHIKRYAETHGVDLTIIPGTQFAKRDVDPVLHSDKDTNIICEDVIRFEAYEESAIRDVTNDIKERFWSVKWRQLDLEQHSDDEDFYNQFWHNKTYYAKSHFMTPKRKTHSNYNQQHTEFIPSDTKWTHAGFYDEEDRDEKEIQEAKMITEISQSNNEIDRAMPGLASWRDQQDIVKRDQSRGDKYKHKKKKKPNRYTKGNPEYGHPGKAATCKCLILNKRMTTEVLITSVVDYRRICVVQPTHPSWAALQILERNMFNFYDPHGEGYNEDRLIELSRDAPLSTVCACPDIFNRNESFSRGKVEKINKTEDTVTIWFLDYGGYCEYHRKDIYEIDSRFLSIPFQARMVELVNLNEDASLNTPPIQIPDVIQAVVTSEIITTPSSLQPEEASNSENPQSDMKISTPSTPLPQPEQSYTELATPCSPCPEISSEIRPICESTPIRPKNDSELDLSSARDLFTQQQIVEQVSYNNACTRLLTHDEKDALEMYRSLEDISELQSSGHGLYAEVVKEVENHPKYPLWSPYQWIRLFRYDYTTGSKKKIYVDFRPELAQEFYANTDVNTDAGTFDQDLSYYDESLLLESVLEMNSISLNDTSMNVNDLSYPNGYDFQQEVVAQAMAVVQTTAILSAEAPAFVPRF